MRTGRLRALLPVCCLLAACRTAGAQGAYNVIDVGALPDGTDTSRATAINNKGNVVGSSIVLENGQPATHAFLYRYLQQMVDLGRCEQTAAEPLTVNSFDFLAGRLTAPNHLTGFVRDVLDATWMIIWFFLPDGFGEGINDMNSVVGTNGFYDGVRLNSRRGFYEDAFCQILDVPLLPGGAENEAHKISQMNEVVGHSGIGPESRPVHGYFWQPGTTPIDLGVLDGDSDSAALNISPQGARVVGRSGRDVGGMPVYRGALWLRDSGFAKVSLGQLTPGLSTEMLAVNDSGVAVGKGYAAPDDLRAVIWSNGQGLQDLNLLISDPRWVLMEATGINSQGQICGTGRVNGRIHGFLLDPQ